MAKSKGIARPKSDKRRLVRLELTPESHAKLRVLAARHGQPMSQYVRELVEKNLEKSSE